MPCAVHWMDLEIVILSEISQRKTNIIWHHLYVESKESESEVAQSCLTLCDPVDCSLPGSSIHGIHQGRILEWVAISFSRGSSRPRYQTCVSCTAGRHFTLWATREGVVSKKGYKWIYLQNRNRVTDVENKLMVQFSSVVQSCPTLCDPMNRSMPGVHHQLLESTQTHVHRVSDAIQPSHPLSSPSPPAPNPSQHQSLFQWVNSSHEVAKILEFQL